MKPHTGWRTEKDQKLYFFTHAKTGRELWRSRMPSVPKVGEVVSTTDRQGRVTRIDGRLVFVEVSQ